MKTELEERVIWLEGVAMGLSKRVEALEKQIAVVADGIAEVMQAGSPSDG